MSDLRRAWMTGGTAALCCALLFAAPALAADPEEAQYNVAVTLYNAGQWEAAVKQIEAREKLDLPEAMRSKYLYAKGLAYEKGRRAKEARAAYEQLLAKHPKAAEADAARLAGLYIDYAAGATDAVLAAYPKLDPAKLSAAAKTDVALIYAEALFAKGDHANAAAAYKAALAAGADANTVRPKLFDLHRRMGQNAELLAVSGGGGGVPGVPADTLAMVRSEALLATGKFAEADAEGQKVPQNSAFFPRASFARAQALIKLGKLKAAAAPLEIAVAKLKDPPAPPAAYLALAECYLEGGRAGEVDKLLAQAAEVGKALPEAERTKMQSQMAVLKIRAASGGGGDRKKTIQAITAARGTLPKEQLGKVLYMRLFALSEEGDPKALLATMKNDYPVFQQGEEDGPATLIYANALKATGDAEEANKLLEGLVTRKPDSPDALRARLALANAAVEKGDHAKATTLFDAIAAAPQAQEKLGKPALDEVRFNQGVIAMKLGDAPGCVAALKALLAGSPGEEIAGQALPLLGQAYATQKDYANAAAAWKQALAGSGAKPADGLDLRDRLARALYAQNDHAGVVEQYAAAVKLAGGEAKLPREAREVWVRSLFASKKFAEAAAMSADLAEQFRDHPAYAYEAGVAFDKAGKPADAAKWYGTAREGKAKLPAEYAAAVDANLASLRLSAGEGDLGAPLFVERATTVKEDAAFDAAAAALRKIAAAGKLGESNRGRLESAMKALPADQPRRYTLGAIVLQSLAAEGKTKPMSQLAVKLADEFAAHEKKLDPKSSGATVAPAMILFYKGEALRLADQFAEALAAYETVLAAYPYNEWPDAAACGAAECYAALGDKATAAAKYREVIAANASAAANSPSLPWRDLAQKRVAELEKGS